MGSGVRPGCAHGRIRVRSDSAFRIQESLLFDRSLRTFIANTIIGHWSDDGGMGRNGRAAQKQCREPKTSHACLSQHGILCAAAYACEVDAAWSSQQLHAVKTRWTLDIRSHGHFQKSNSCWVFQVLTPVSFSTFLEETTKSDPVEATPSWA